MLVLDDNIYKRLELIARKHRIDVTDLVEALVHYFVGRSKEFEVMTS
ncbi:MAG: hypothetical protein QXX69_03600 [Sulfolobales archaeon]